MFTTYLFILALLATAASATAECFSGSVHLAVNKVQTSTRLPDNLGCVLGANRK